MRWPWVSRLAFDAVVAERDRLVAEREKLLEHVTRMDRVDRGLGETPKRPRVPIEPPPREFMDYVQGFASKHMRQDTLRIGMRRAAQGVPWDKVLAEMQTPPNLENGEQP